MGCANLDDPGGLDGSTDGTACAEGSHRCLQESLQVCEHSVYTAVESCTSPKVCSAGLKTCVDCDPNLEQACKGGDIYTCWPDGTFGTRVKSCPNAMCAAGVCTDPCSVAGEKRSYIGCSYWPTVTVNTSLPRDFSFALAVANPNSEEVTVTVASKDDPSLASVSVAADSLSIIKLPWITALKQLPNSRGSVLIDDGAYHLTSTLPVMVYQFNPLNYELPAECTIDQDQNQLDGICNSHTNDASLLLPEHALGDRYIVVSRPSMTVCPLAQTCSGSSGFFTVVNPQPGTTKVDIAFAADTLVGHGNLSAYKKGDTASFDLPPWGVLQVLSDLPTCSPVKTDFLGNGYCDLSVDTDLTGTEISAEGNVAVFSGTDCTFVPFDKWACDHLEEQLYPVVSWGKHYIGTHTKSSGDDPCLYRLVSAADNNTIELNPEVHGAVTLDRGEHLDFEATKDFEAEGDGPFILTQFMVGQGYSNPIPLTGAPGDPSMALSVPVEQYRSTYRFLAPDTFQQNYVNVIAPQNATVLLDGNPIDPTLFTPIGEVDFSGWMVAKLEISGGTHTVECSAAVGISVYGVASYTSYMYPGGLDLKELIQ
jgi:hypothetical protein